MKKFGFIISLVLGVVLFTFSCADENSKGRTFSGASGGSGGSGGTGGGGSGGGGGTLTEDPVFIATIDGKIVEFNADNATGGSPVSISGDEYIFRSYFLKAMPSTSVSISKGTLTYAGGGGKAGETEFSNFFTLGSLDYSIEAADGIDISYQDENEVNWSTSLDLGFQTGASFIIEELKEETIQGAQYMKFKAKFNCTLYDEVGNTLELKDGSCISHFGNL